MFRATIKVGNRLLWEGHQWEEPNEMFFELHEALPHIDGSYLYEAICYFETGDDFGGWHPAGEFYVAGSPPMIRADQ